MNCFDIFEVGETVDIHWEGTPSVFRAIIIYTPCEGAEYFTVKCENGLPMLIANFSKMQLIKEDNK